MKVNFCRFLILLGQSPYLTTVERLGELHKINPHRY